MGIEVLNEDPIDVASRKFLEETGYQFISKLEKSYFICWFLKGFYTNYLFLYKKFKIG
jgi:hypothetical protein